MPENQAVLFLGLILGVLRILLFQGRSESPGLAKECIFEENSKRAGVLLRGFEADLYIFKQISQYLIKSIQLYWHPACNI